MKFIELGATQKTSRPFWSMKCEIHNLDDTFVSEKEFDAKFCQKMGRVWYESAEIDTILEEDISTGVNPSIYLGYAIGDKSWSGGAGLYSYTISSRSSYGSQASWSGAGKKTYAAGSNFSEALYSVGSEVCGDRESKSWGWVKNCAKPVSYRQVNFPSRLASYGDVVKVGYGTLESYRVFPGSVYYYQAYTKTLSNVGSYLNLDEKWHLPNDRPYPSSGVLVHREKYALSNLHFSGNTFKITAELKASVPAFCHI